MEGVVSNKCEAQAQILDMLQTCGDNVRNYTVKEEWRIEMEGEQGGRELEGCIPCKSKVYEICKLEVGGTKIEGALVWLGN